MTKQKTKKILPVMLSEEEVIQEILQETNKGNIFLSRSHDYSPYPYGYGIDIGGFVNQTTNRCESFAHVDLYVGPESSSGYAVYTIRIPPIVELIDFNEQKGITKESRRRYDTPDLFEDSFYFHLHRDTPAAEILPRARVLRKTLPNIINQISNNKIKTINDLRHFYPERILNKLLGELK